MPTYSSFRSGKLAVIVGLCHIRVAAHFHISNLYLHHKNPLQCQSAEPLRMCHHVLAFQYTNLSFLHFVSFQTNLSRQNGPEVMVRAKYSGWQLDKPWGWCHRPMTWQRHPEKVPLLCHRRCPKQGKGTLYVYAVRDQTASPEPHLKQHHSRKRCCFTKTTQSCWNWCL